MSDPRLEFISKGPTGKTLSENLCIKEVQEIVNVFSWTVVYSLIGLMREDVLVLPTDRLQLDKGLALYADDIEDALQYECAKAAGCDVIITNNGKDYADFSTLPYMTAAEFLSEWNK